MKLFILTAEPDSAGIIRLEGKDRHYLTRVRRMAVGEIFPALLPSGEEVSVKILSITKNTLTVKPCCAEPHYHVNSLPESKRLILLQALPKADKMDIIVRQAAESGISEIVPFVSEFSVAKTKTEGQKFSRWERIIKEARQQSGSKTETKLHNPMLKEDILNYWQKVKEKGALGLLFHHVRSIDGSGVLEQNSLHRYLEGNPKIVVFVIGPEGGFSDAEVALFLENGFKPLTIGDTILRTETAALYCAAAIRITLLERESWELKKT